MMKVLWFAGNPSLYVSAGNTHGGMIGALQHELAKTKAINLAVAFPWSCDFKDVRGSIAYYGIKDITHPIFRFLAKQKKQLQRLQNVIEDFRPDVIHVYGTEIGFGLVTSVTHVPVVIHIQGVLGAVYEAWMPPNMSWWDAIMRHPRMFLGYDALHRFIPREREIFRHCKYFMGRTEWDQHITMLLAPNAEYFHCDEMLRPEIYQASPWEHHGTPRLTIASTISAVPYKGADVVLRTAKLLKQTTNLDFEWNLYGVNNLESIECQVGIRANEVHVSPKGAVDVNQLVAELQAADIFVHPSYIENSSNAICEAQCIGMPIIATHVGGTTSLVEHEKTGIIIPANDIYMLASQIMRLANDANKCVSLGKTARRAAKERHNPQKIVSDLLNVYKSIING